jgi:hypothetical protein
MTENIGIREQWIEQGWTEQQMMDRIAEIEKDSPKPWCQLQPYILNYLQSPDLNQRVLDNLDQLSYNDVTDDNDNDNSDNYWIAASNLWTPGQDLTISFSAASPANMVATVKKYLMADLQPYVSMKIQFVNSGGMVVVNIASMSGAGGNSAVGHTQTGQMVNLNSSSMTDNAGANFNWARYLVLHEFGHCMGLWHEWNREMCGRNGITCSATQDSYSVMNYPAGSTGGAADAKPSANTMDHYSPTDIEWLLKVYKGTGVQPPPMSNQPQPPQQSQQPQPPQPPRIQPSLQPRIRRREIGTSPPDKPPPIQPPVQPSSVQPPPVQPPSVQPPPVQPTCPPIVETTPNVVVVDPYVTYNSPPITIAVAIFMLLVGTVVLFFVFGCFKIGMVFAK